MELKKRKYKRKEVSAIILALHKNYQEKLSECKEKIIELARENTEIKTQLDAYLSKENLISSTLINVEKNSQDMREQAQLNYKLELDRLKRFSQKWDEYFRLLMEKYPMYQKVQEAVSIIEKVKNSDETIDAKILIEEIDDTLEKEQAFNPKSKILDYVASTSDNGFNMEDVLNPGELKLEDLCKELGLID